MQPRYDMLCYALLCRRVEALRQLYQRMRSGESVENPWSVPATENHTSGADAGPNREASVRDPSEAAAWAALERARAAARLERAQHAPTRGQAGFLEGVDGSGSARAAAAKLLAAKAEADREVEMPR